MDEYVNPIVDGVISWWSINSCASNSEEALEHWNMKYLQGDVLILPAHYARLELRYMIHQIMMD